MKEYKKIKLELLNIQIGCTLRHARLKTEISQQNLATSLGYTSTMVGRVERFENISGWDKIFSIAQELKVNYCNLFILQSQDELLAIVDQSYKLEEKLNQDKRDYYEFLRKTIIKNYILLSKAKKDA
jgi:transcriptional regulator with XRE-family HTH domain